MIYYRMAQLEKTYLPQARVRNIPHLETEVSGMRRVYTLPYEPVMVWHTPIPHAYITDTLYTTDLPHNRTVSPDMVMVSPTMRVGQLFPLRLDRERLGEIYNELARENTLFFSRKGIFLVDGTDREARNLQFDGARFSVFEDDMGTMRHQENGKKPEYYFDEVKRTAEIRQFLKKVFYKGEERNAVLAIQFSKEFLKDSKLHNLILNGKYDPYTLRKFLSYSFLIS